MRKIILIKLASCEHAQNVYTAHELYERVMRKQVELNYKHGTSKREIYRTKIVCCYGLIV